MVLGHYTISDHAKEQYVKRCRSMKNKDIEKSIRTDLRTLNIKNIIYGKSTIHVFTHGYKEFIFFKKNRMLILRTFIQFNATSSKYHIRKRQKQSLVKS